VVTGAFLEAVFGRGTVGLLDAADGAALGGSVGALLGVVAVGLGSTCLNGVTLVPWFALLGKLRSLYPTGREGLGLMDELSARTGALCSVILGVCVSLTCGAMCAGLALEWVYGKAGPTPALHWGTTWGALAGGVAGLVEMGHRVWRALPKRWQEEVRRGFSPPRPGTLPSRRQLR
jgi:hypothetical protein